MAMPVMHLSPKRVSYAALPSVADILSQEIKHAAKSWNAYCSIFALKGQPRKERTRPCGLTGDRPEVVPLHCKISSHKWIVRQSYFLSLGRGGMQPLKQVRQAHFSNSE
jgi:hypothetical protein